MIMSKKNMAVASLTLLCSAFATSAVAQDAPPQTTDTPPSQPESSLSADNEALYEELTAQAEELFTSRQYDESIALLEQAYKLKPSNSNTLYNIARVYEEKADLAKALEYYDRFVVAPNVNLEFRREALARAKTIREILAVKEARDTTNEKVAEETEPQPVETVMVPSPWRNVGYVMLGVGSVSVVSGLVLGILASGAESDFNASTDIEDARDLASSAESYATVADILYISGAVVGVTGLIMAIVADPTEVQSASKFDVQVGPNQFGAAWTTKF